MTDVGTKVSCGSDGSDRGDPVGRYAAIGRDGKPCRTYRPGVFGGHRGMRIYGRLDCPSALRAIARGGYVTYRVFFPDESSAIAAGYPPCAVCMPDRYRAWKASHPRGRR